MSISGGSSAEFQALLARAAREHSAGRPAEAAAAYRAVLTIRPDIAEVHVALGIILAQQGQLDEAAALFRHAIALKPNLPDSHNNLGIVLKDQGKLDAAKACFRRALSLRPNFAEAHNNLGSVLWMQEKTDLAAAEVAKALALRPAYPEALSNLGNLLFVQSRFDEGLARFEQALALRPDYAEAHHDLGTALLLLGRVDEAMARFQRALALRPGDPAVQLSLAAGYLLQGDYRRGWPLYESRLRMPGAPPQPAVPRWSGQPLAGHSLLLIAEQGLGDTIQLLRFARSFKDRGARVILAAQRALGRLLAAHPDLDEVVLLDPGQPLPASDFHLPLHSVPGALEIEERTIPRSIPYLWADPQLVEKWRQELAGIDGFKIGIVWQGSRDFGQDRWRSLHLSQFAALAGLPGVRLVSLQKGFGSEQIAGAGFPVLDFSDRLDEAAGPFMDTAALIANLDLLVTSDTAIVHLAGALGAPAWVALHRTPNWRWLLDREDSPWYPTMRLFRQKSLGAWSVVFERIGQAIQQHRLGC